jgi:NAD+ synthase (glutamine-hydrolysing)
LHDPRRRQERLDASTDDFLVETIALRPLMRRAAAEIAVRRLEEIAPLSHEEEIYRALLVGTRDYVRKNGFERVVIGLSGGVDSALTACLAADALGAEHVTCVYMPTRYSAAESGRDAEDLARRLGTPYLVIPIDETFEQYLRMLRPEFEGTPLGVAEENIQARIRGNILMALSNKFGAMVLSTGNKSEISVGYCTLYGDMAGGFALLKDVPKTLVYRLSAYVNARGRAPVIPEYILTRPPSAELRADQKDTDSLPPYEILDAILERYIEDDLSIEAIISEGYEPSTVRWVARQVDLNEYKRRQAAPGIKITTRAFGRDRRMPITNKFHG